MILSAAEPEWKEGLKYLRKLYSEGLIDKGAFTQNGDAVKQLGNKAENVVGTVGYALISSVLEPTDAKPAIRNTMSFPAERTEWRSAGRL